MNRYHYLVLALSLSGCSIIQHKTGAEPVGVSKELHPTAEVLCVPPYGTFDIQGSGGKVTIGWNADADPAILRVVSEGLLPERNYSVYWMQGGSPWESRECDYGPWRKIGSFTTHEDGKGLFQTRLSDHSMPLGRGFFSIWINDTETSGTLLVSHSFEIVFNLK